MSRIIELPDTVFNALQRQAEQERTTPAEWIAERLPRLPQSRGDRTNEENPSDNPLNAWDVLDTLIGTVDAPDDWSTEHDHYISGAPKRRKGV